MRISDWSSDVCSSDLIATRYGEFLLIESVGDLRHAIAVGEGLKQPVLAFEHADRPAEAALGAQRRQQAFPRRMAGMGALHLATAVQEGADTGGRACGEAHGGLARSEEHQSETPSAMLNSYAVF